MPQIQDAVGVGGAGHQAAIFEFARYPQHGFGALRGAVLKRRGLVDHQGAEALQQLQVLGQPLNPVVVHDDDVGIGVKRFFAVLTVGNSPGELGRELINVVGPTRLQDRQGRKHQHAAVFFLHQVVVIDDATGFGVAGLLHPARLTRPFG